MLKTNTLKVLLLLVSVVIVVNTWRWLLITLHFFHFVPCPKFEFQRKLLLRRCRRSDEDSSELQERRTTTTPTSNRIRRTFSTFFLLLSTFLSSNVCWGVVDFVSGTILHERWFPLGSAKQFKSTKDV